MSEVGADSVLSPADRMIVIAALHDRAGKLTCFVEQCESIPVEHRNFPTDRPETWKPQLDATLALLARLGASNE